MLGLVALFMSFALFTMALFSVEAWNRQASLSASGLALQLQFLSSYDWSLHWLDFSLCVTISYPFPLYSYQISYVIPCGVRWCVVGYICEGIVKFWLQPQYWSHISYNQNDPSSAWACLYGFWWSNFGSPYSHEHTVKWALHSSF